jgi:hypothetical protein
MSSHYLKRLALGTLLGAFGLQAQVTIPAEFAYPLSAASAANRGFSVLMKQATTAAGTLPNSTARTEAQLAGTLINSKTGQPHTNTIDFAAAAFNADGTFTETTTINYEQAGSTGQSFPGIPGLEGGTDNIAMEVVSWLELQAGTYSMIVNSDDGFRVTVGKDARDKTSVIKLGEYEGGRGAGDSIFNFTVTQAGLYSFRLIWQEGNGGANCSWFTASVDDPSNRVLVNGDGGVKAYSKISAATPSYVSFLDPGIGAENVSPGAMVTAVINNGSSSTIAASSVKLTFDGAAVAATVTQANGATTVTYDPPGLLEPGSKHAVQIEYSEGTTARKFEYSFTAATTGNITLPTPIWLENFDTTAEGAVPTGWTLQNLTTGANGTVDYDDPSSDAYLDWVVIPKTRVETARWDAGRRLNITEQFVNGEQVKSLINGNFLYAESDNRGGSQIQYAFSPDVNLSGKANIYLSFHNIYEQNQDSMGAVEYSIDKGATWLPVLYMLDGPDIKKDADGNVDGYETMIAENGDAASYEDPITGEPRGKAYGAFIGVATNEWKNIAPFIQARINDDAVESKRVELFRLPKADNQANVRLRFAQAGTGSWYFGIDNVGFYSINTVAKPVLAASPVGLSLTEGSKATFVAEGRGEGISYQWQFNSTNIVGATNTSFVIDSVKLSNSGNYRVVVSNTGGSVTSADAVLKVILADPAVVTGQWDFNGNLDATVGTALQYFGDTASITAFEDATIGGKPAKVMSFGAATKTQGYLMTHGAGANGGGTKVNQYTLIMDVMFPAASDGKWRGLLQTEPSNANDGDLFVNGANGIGISGQYQGKVVADTWHRLAFAFNLNEKSVSKYIDGVLVNKQTLGEGFDGRWALGSTALLFTDEDNETAAGLVNSVQIRSGTLSEAEIAALGGATAEGIPGVASTGIKIAGITAGGGNVTITWTGGAGIKLQSAATLGGAWTDVAGSVGASTATVPAGDAAAFFRLVK